MNWTEQTESMMKIWNDAQKQFLGGAYNALGGMPGLSGISAMPDLSNLTNWFKPEFSPGFPLWGTSGGGSTSQAAAGNLFVTQIMMMQGFGVLTKAWEAIAPSLSAGEPWQVDFDAFLRQWSEEITSTLQRFSTAGTGMKELMESLLGEWAPLLKPWLASIQGTGLGRPIGDLLSGEKLPFRKMLGIDMDPAFQNLAQIPMMGVNREQMAKITRVFDSHVDLRKAVYKYQTAIGTVIGESLKETIERLIELSKKGEQISGVRELMRMWVKITDRKITQMYVTDEFVAIQAEMSEASLKNKLAQRSVLEMIFAQFDIPTRTEIDDAYKTLYNLKKEVRELRDERKRMDSEVMESRNVSKKLETEVASLRDAFQKMEVRLAEDLVKVAASVKATEPVKTLDSANSGSSPSTTSAVGARSAGDKGKEPVKTIKKKVVSSPKATT
uniref:Poly(3-hydroxyalkanoate) polymerase subunit PhaE n=1 Tax=Candidatus Kentrum sp. TUN TaxID=2126343 RepID=A0A450ZPJ2_9GAMM|nr:MAG: poly(R)-hydroxyalkanoic acid synthase, class III, PhaE subunit [Candidatus Kentron sp. TUN]VFK61741.1 MAG: poly(R)-hydroxyalkanoic acid synthase, class III, PhaE subunit [Candidatus Kentron sp. TUN]